jgi:hypothetical protein
MSEDDILYDAFEKEWKEDFEDTKQDNLSFYSDEDIKSMLEAYNVFYLGYGNEPDFPFSEEEVKREMIRRDNIAGALE